MIRFLHKSASLVGLCMLALAIGCGGSSKKKVTCDGGLCGDAGKDVSGEVRKDGSSDTLAQPDVARPDTGVLPDTNPLLQPDTGVSDALVVVGDAPSSTPDTQIVTADTGTDGLVVTPDTRALDTRLADTLVVTPDTRLADTNVTPTTDTASDTPVNVDAAVDAGHDASVVDANPSDAGGDADDSDAGTDA